MEAAHGRETAPPPADPPTSSGRAGRNLPVAVAVGAGLGALVLVSLYTIKEIFLGVMTFFLAYGVRELSQAFRAQGIRLPQVPSMAAVVAALVAAYVAGMFGLLAAVALAVPALLVWRMFIGTRGYVRDSTAGLFIVAYVALMGGIVSLMLSADDGAQRIVIFIAVTVSSDIGGYFAGAFLGRHKMAPVISPKKTWEGFAGSALACMLVGAGLVPWLLDGGRLWQGALLGAAVVCAATAGDLVESVIKRDLGIKDLGTLLPGHGGVMDRLDSLIVAAPVVWLLLELFVRTT
ncbi:MULTISPECIES: phosphatidate cytidylyltransferase [Thermomonospora]|uniref:Phosphatidate cytidylyltransferase n=1 Tax=Thermomonospora curvata (strain ATCC 19995 / DSM 43183 / JCM 3096 / KCTC 9072 / NBRC 15933 / NCIMB 10081 / Henssen B9) TaxID=471852 RepID=D1AB01_THECD|nr:MULTISPECIES: phosphatidate cytidylyltransferase [Thermomonospora]ACY98944.1 phosphatidate cytidylyltransferase [Thermomonospora curvata DSM 43183]PKK13141.1 MAG: phosphatidate cytidylyltransferase [Thermomonospora sp. CIF 1]